VNSIGLKPWREIATPHPDVASGRYAQAEFAADLAQVHRGEGTDEYRDPVEFYQRTFLTHGLRHLLSGAMLRLAGRGGDLVVELQTNFGGGKTHSLLALFHLADHPNQASLPGIDSLMSEIGLAALPKGRKAVLVGTALSPGQPNCSADGFETRTLWGELACQLGKAEGYAMVAQSDQAGISPGSNVLTDLLKRYSPCVVLLDEWVAFVRMLYHVEGQPAGSFDANLTFAQAPSEAARAVPQALVVASLPASRIEIGGQGGQEALTRLKNTFGRIEASWQPATADESFEIVRRRRFEPIADRDAAANRDAVVRGFGEMYRGGAGEYPLGCGEGDYARRMQAAYPIHPELFERLYNDWGSLDKFQRTRGVLRFMAATIHVLWERNDAGLLILPSSIPLDSPVIQSELVRYLDHNWSAVLAKDIDGATSVPLAIDQEVPALGRDSATRRVARTVWMGSAPTFQGKNPGIDDRRIKLGCAQPGESAGNFGDALRRLADRATYLYQDGTRYWFSTQPSVARLAEDRAAELERRPADVEAEIVKRLKRNEARPMPGEFAGVHAAPDNSGSVGDEPEARLVIIGPNYPHSARDSDSKAIEGAKNILLTRGSGQRNCRNALVFLAADQQRLPELEQAVRSWMAWSSIVSDSEALNLDPFQKRQAESKAEEFNNTIETRLFETWNWALAPVQPNANDPAIEWDSERVQGNDSLAARAAKRFANKEAFFTRIGPARIKMALNQWLWRDQKHLPTRQLWEWFATYLYLPRLRDAEVLRRAIEEAIGGLANDTFAYAERYDEERDRYIGLKVTGGGSAIVDSQSVIVKTEVALAQLATDRRATEAAGEKKEEVAASDAGDGTTSARGFAEPAKVVCRYLASLALDPDRPSRDMGRVAEEVLAHLSTLPRAKLRITVEIDAEVPDGVPEDIQRIVLENGTALKFAAQSFERS
jgi:uncharacterized protein